MSDGVCHVPAPREPESPLVRAALDQAMASHRAGRLLEAEGLCDQVLRRDRNNVEALYLAGAIALLTRRPQRSAELIARAIRLDPDVAAFHCQLGDALGELGRPREALASYDKAIALEPDFADAYYNRGIVLKYLDRLEDALASYDRAIALKPDYAEAYYNRGNVLGELGRPHEALASYDRAIALRPDHAKAYDNRGNVLVDLKRLDEALESYDAAIALKPDHAEAHYNRGTVLEELRRPDDALRSYDDAIALRPDFARAHYNRGNLLEKLRRPGDALASYDKAIALKPDFAAAHGNRGNVLGELNRPDDALESYDAAIALKPDHAEAHYNRGNALLTLQRPDGALASYDRAIALKPDFAAAHSNRGNALSELQRFADALASYERAIALRPDFAQAHSNRGNALKELRRFADALKSYERAIALNPDFAQAHVNQGLCLLLLGRFAQGWREYEWRKKRPVPNGARSYPQPLWLGNESVAGKTLLIHSEQGLGDTLQFCRYAGLASRLGARVVLEVQPALRPLLAGLDGAAQVLAAGAALPSVDYHCPMLSLPLAFKTEIDTIPADVPYIRSDARRVAAWRARLGRTTRPRVALTWSGNSLHGNDQNRSLALAELLPLVDERAEWISLQKEARPADADLMASRADIRSLGAHLQDFADTAAVIELVDLVVTVDTSVAHVAGAMGKPVWILLPFIPDWRWLLDRDDSPWYPTAKLFRQPQTGNWAGVIERVRRELPRALGAGHGA